MIEVILLERIERLGHMGQKVKVRPGFARNYLLPQKKALRATKTNMELFEKQRAQLEAQNAAARGKAQDLAVKLDGVTLVIIRQASETGQLYGSVSARDVSDAAKEASQPIDRAQVQIDQPIKTLGLFPIKVKLHPEVTIKITVNVARSAEEAVVQAEKSASAAAKAEKLAAQTGMESESAGTAESSESKDEAATKPARKTKAKAKAADEDGEEVPAKSKTAAKDKDEEHAPKAKAAKAHAKDASKDKDGEPKAKKPRAKKTAADE